MTRHTRAIRLVSLLAAGGIAATALSCQIPAQPGPDAAAAEQLAKIDPSQIPLAKFGQLPVFVTDQTTDGRNVRLRGMIFNPYPEPVDGVRVIFRILPTASADARELDRFHKETDDHIPSGGHVPLRFDVQTMYAGQGGRWGFDLLAFAIKRGGKELPPPPDTRE